MYRSRLDSQLGRESPRRGLAQQSCLFGAPRCEREVATVRRDPLEEAVSRRPLSGVRGSGLGPVIAFQIRASKLENPLQHGDHRIADLRRSPKTFGPDHFQPCVELLVSSFQSDRNDGLARGGMMDQATRGDGQQSEACRTYQVKAVSVASPAYNEAQGIEQVVRHWIEYLRRLPRLDRFEIVVCNDGSRDDTGVILDRLAAQLPELKPIHSDRNRGAGAVLERAIRHTTCDWVLLLDSDGQFPIENLAPMIEAVESRQLPCATGVRTKKDHWFARYGSRGSSIVANIFHGTRYRDFNAFSSWCTVPSYVPSGSRPTG